MASLKHKLIGLEKLDIPTAGTRVRYSGGATSRLVTTLILKAASANTGNIFVGDETVDSTHGHPLAPGESLTINADQDSENEDKTVLDLNDVYFDTATNGNDVHISVVDLVSVSYNS